VDAELIRALDADGSGSVDRYEFLSYMLVKQGAVDAAEVSLPLFFKTNMYLGACRRRTPKDARRSERARPGRRVPPDCPPDGI
jgi:hypothetical protein